MKSLTATPSRPPSLLPFSKPHLHHRKTHPISSPNTIITNKINNLPTNRLTICTAIRNSSNRSKTTSNSNNNNNNNDDNDGLSRLVQSGLWLLEGVYILWLFLLPFAPGDPVWAISSDTINSILGLSLNFFFVLPLANAVGIHVMEAPILHPMSEGLFNFVVSWTLMFAPLLYTDFKRDRYKGSLDILWGLQMFLTNTFLIPYMAIRLNQADEGSYPTKPSKLGTVMIKGSPTVGYIGGGVCLLSILWAFFGRADGDFGNLSDRWNFLLSYLGSERLAYAFIWDIILYTFFQPWLIGENLANVEENTVAIVNYLRFVPVVGLFAYLLCLDREGEFYMDQ